MTSVEGSNAAPVRTPLPSLTMTAMARPSPRSLRSPPERSTGLRIRSESDERGYFQFWRRCLLVGRPFFCRLSGSYYSVPYLFTRSYVSRVAEHILSFPMTRRVILTKHPCHSWSYSLLRKLGFSSIFLRVHTTSTNLRTRRFQAQ